jgi:hypothetical protein
VQETAPQRADPGPRLFDKQLVPGFTAENELEWAVACDPDVQRGWASPVQGAGHPERLVGAHVAAILRSIGLDDPVRSSLRFLALVHDSIIWAAGAPGNDHAVLARRVAERHTSDRSLLLTIELHEEAYRIFTTGRAESGGLEKLMARLPDAELFIRFVELDAATEGRDPTFMLWLRSELGRRGLLPPRRHQERVAAELESALSGGARGAVAEARSLSAA